MDIKLKDKILFLLKIIIGASVIFMICFGIFYVVDILRERPGAGLDR